MISYDFFEANEGDELFELEKLNFGISILSPPFIADSWAQIPAAVQLAVVIPLGQGWRSSKILLTNSCTRCGCDPS